MRMSGIPLILLTAVTLVLAGCNEDLGRPTSYEKGEYAGKADEKLSQDTVKALRNRGRQQQ